MSENMLRIGNLECITRYACQLRHYRRLRTKVLTPEEFNIVDSILDQISDIEMTPAIQRAHRIRFHLIVIVGHYTKARFKYQFPSPFPERAWALLTRYEASAWGANLPKAVRQEEPINVYEVRSSTDQAEAVGQDEAAASDDLGSRYWKSAVVDSNLRLPCANHPIYGVDGIMRGILIANARIRTYILDPRFKQRHANVAGHNNHKVGDWWPMQICTLRDGAHGAKVSGISGSVKSGAHSVVLSGTYDQLDADRGDTLYYCGSHSLGNTDPNNPVWSCYTESLRVASNLKQSVRVLRNSKSNSPWSPSHGVRYDGLYTVTGEETRHNSHGGAYVRFRLDRVSGQPAIDMSRPTKEEIALCERIPLTY